MDWSCWSLFEVRFELREILKFLCREEERFLIFDDTCTGILNKGPTASLTQGTKAQKRGHTPRAHQTQDDSEDDVTPLQLLFWRKRTKRKDPRQHDITIFLLAMARLFLSAPSSLVLLSLASMSIHHTKGSSATKDPLRVCVLIEPSPFSYVSGYANRFQALLEHLSSENDQVQVVTVECLAKDPPNDWKGIPIAYTGAMPLPHYPTMSVCVDYSLKTLRTVWSMKPHVLHVSSPGFMVFGALFCARFLQIPIVMSYHTHLPVYVRCYLPWGVSHAAEWVTWQLIRVVHSWADLTVVTSPQIQEEFQKHGVPKVQVWQKGIDTDRFHPSFRSETMRKRMTNDNPRDFLIVYIGRLGTEKRLKDLKAVLEKVQGARLCIVGGGPQEMELQDYFQGTNTVFTGMLSGEELSKAFASGDVFCMPSDSETLGFVVLESMASGVPVVGAAAGGVKDLIHEGITGFLVPTADTNAFAEKIQYLKDNKNLRKQMSKQGRLETERWSWPASMEKLRTEQYSLAQNNFHNRLEQRFWRFVTKGKHSAV